METWNWLGQWTPPNASTGYFTNVSVSPFTSAVVYGSGSGTSAIEASTYVLPNLAGLNSTSTYRFKFRLGSYRFSSTNTTRGVDIGDYIDVLLSTNGGVTYSSEIRITGNNNAYWDYNLNGVISKTANGVLTTYSPTAGGDRTLTGDGYSSIELIIPAGITQCAVNIYGRANSAGEEWWIDNVELIEYYLCVPLSIELLSFEVEQDEENRNLLFWSTATETNNDYFTIERSQDAYSWTEAAIVPGAGTSFSINDYEWLDILPQNGINYYRLKQTDFNGEFKYSQIIWVDNSKKKKEIVKITDLFGREIDPKNFSGIIIHYYSDGSYQKIFNFSNK